MPLAKMKLFEFGDLTRNNLALNGHEKQRSTWTAK
jgi:hypothetical protein